MADEYPDQNLISSFIKNPPSDCTETEQDSDSVWSSASECLSETGSRGTSSAEIISNEPPTVRARPDDDDEIERLIYAAEQLALERARSRQSLSITPKDIPVEKSPKLPNQKQNFDTPQKGVKNYNNYSKHFIGDVDSGFFGNNEEPNKPEKTFLTNFSPEHNLQAPDELEGASDCTSDNNLQKDSRLSVTNITKDFQTPQNFHHNSCETPGKMSHEDIPRLSLDSLNNISCERDACEERAKVSKDVKEVCNSSIREFVFEAPEAEKPQMKATSRRTSVDVRSLQNSEYKASVEISSVIHDECSNLLKLALNSTSSLGHVLRLLRQISTLQLKTEASCVVDNALEELEVYEGQHVSLEAKLKSAAVQLQGLVSQMQNVESQLMEQEEEAARVDQCVMYLLQQVEDGLSASGLQHMIGMTSPRRRSTLRTLEDITSAVPLLLGELTRKISRAQTLEEGLQRQNQEIESLRETLCQKEARLRTMDLELLQHKEHNSRDYTSLKQCLAQAEESLNELYADRTRLSELCKKQSIEHEMLRTRLQQQLSDVNRSMDSRVTELEHSLHDAKKEKQSQESTIAELQNQLSLKTEQIKLSEEENTLLIEELRSTLKKQQAEIEQLQGQFDTANAEKQNASKRVTDLEAELAAEQEKNLQVIQEASLLRSDVQNLKLEHAESIKILQDKVDNGVALRCDLERQVRSADFKILQLRTEMQMETHRSAALAEENTSANKKIQNLQERIWSITRRRRFNSGDSIRSFDDSRPSPACGRDSSSEYGSCASLISSSIRADTVNHMQSLVKDVGDGQMREEQLHTLIREKDIAMRTLQDSVSTQISNKNQELEQLTTKVSILEEQLSSLLSGLEVSAAIGDVTTEVGRLLQERTKHLESIDNSSQWLQEEVSSLAMENQMLSAELNAAKKNHVGMSSEAQGVARKAREEARQERLNSSRMQEKCLRLQAQLDAVQATLEHERQENKMKETIRGVKHQEFSFMLENAAAVQDSLEKM